MLSRMIRRVSHPVKLFEVWTERENGKPVLRTAPLGVIAIDDEKNNERRKMAARARAAQHVGREPSTVMHSDNNSLVVNFRRQVSNA